MLGVTTLPERAVDTWIAVYLASEFPEMSLWAPTQRTAVDFDLSVSEDGKLFVLEQKAPVLHKKYLLHYIQLDVARQLWRYCTDPGLAGLVWYVLPRPPYSAGYAAGRGASLLPDIASARTPGHKWGSGLPCEDWFHIVPARDLYEWLWNPGSTRFFMPPLPPLGGVPPPPPPPVVGKHSFPCDDLLTSGPSNAMTLREWARSVKACFVEGGLVKNGRIVRAGRIQRDGVLVEEGRKVNIPVSEPARDTKAARGSQRRGRDMTDPSRSPGSTRVVFLPRSNLRGR
jgi:hypothetical protein